MKKCYKTLVTDPQNDPERKARQDLSAYLMQECIICGEEATQKDKLCERCQEETRLNDIDIH